MSFEENIKFLFTEDSEPSRRELYIARVFYQAGMAEQKEIDARIAEDSASHNMSSICHAQDIAELIRGQEDETI